MLERFTERARKVVVLAQEEARHFNHNYIGTGHILLGLVRESEGVAARVLSNLGVDPDKVRREVVRMLDADRAAAAHEVGHSDSTEDMQFVRSRRRRWRLRTLRGERRGVSFSSDAPRELEYVYKAQGADDISGLVGYVVLLEESRKYSSAKSFNFFRGGHGRWGARFETLP